MKDSCDYILLWFLWVLNAHLLPIWTNGLLCLESAFINHWKKLLHSIPKKRVSCYVFFNYAISLYLWSQSFNNTLPESSFLPNLKKIAMLKKTRPFNVGSLKVVLFTYRDMLLRPKFTSITHTLCFQCALKQTWLIRSSLSNFWQYLDEA